MKQFLIIIFCGFLAACVPQEPTSLVYDKDVIPISDPIQLRYNPCQFKSVIETMENNVTIYKEWANRRIEKMEDLLLWEIDINKITTKNKTYSPSSPPIIHKKILTDIYGNIKKQSVSMQKFRNYVNSNTSLSDEAHEALDSIIHSFTKVFDEANHVLKLTETPIKTGDYIFGSPFNNRGRFKLQGYGFYENRKVLIANMDDKFDVRFLIMEEAKEKFEKEQGSDISKKLEKALRAYVEETEKEEMISCKGYAIIDPVTCTILKASFKISSGGDEVSTIIKQTLF